MPEEDESGIYRRYRQRNRENIGEIRICTPSITLETGHFHI
jgi:hypothetical protein